MASEGLDVSTIRDEDLLRRLWQKTEDLSQKKVIRAHMYKLREQRLKEFYTTGEVLSDVQKVTPQKFQLVSSPIEASDFVVKPSKYSSNAAETMTHADSIEDHGFMTMKTKEIRDSESPTRSSQVFQDGKGNNEQSYWKMESSSRSYRTVGNNGEYEITSQAHQRKMAGENDEVTLNVAYSSQDRAVLDRNGDVKVISSEKEVSPYAPIARDVEPENAFHRREISYQRESFPDESVYFIEGSAGGQVSQITSGTKSSEIRSSSSSHVHRSSTQTQKWSSSTRTSDFIQDGGNEDSFKTETKGIVCYDDGRPDDVSETRTTTSVTKNGVTEVTKTVLRGGKLITETTTYIDGKPVDDRSRRAISSTDIKKKAPVETVTMIRGGKIIKETVPVKRSGQHTCTEKKETTVVDNSSRSSTESSSRIITSGRQFTETQTVEGIETFNNQKPQGSDDHKNYKKNISPSTGKGNAPQKTKTVIRGGKVITEKLPPEADINIDTSDEPQKQRQNDRYYFKDDTRPEEDSPETQEDKKRPIQAPSPDFRRTQPEKAPVVKKHEQDHAISNDEVQKTVLQKTVTVIRGGKLVKETVQLSPEEAAIYNVKDENFSNANQVPQRNFTPTRPEEIQRNQSPEKASPDKAKKPLEEKPSRDSVAKGGKWPDDQGRMPERKPNEDEIFYDDDNRPMKIVKVIRAGKVLKEKVYLTEDEMRQKKLETEPFADERTPKDHIPNKATHHKNEKNPDDNTIEREYLTIPISKSEDGKPERESPDRFEGKPYDQITPARKPLEDDIVYDDHLRPMKIVTVIRAGKVVKEKVHLTEDEIRQREVREMRRFIDEEKPKDESPRKESPEKYGRRPEKERPERDSPDKKSRKPGDQPERESPDRLGRRPRDDRPEGDSGESPTESPDRKGKKPEDDYLMPGRRPSEDDITYDDNQRPMKIVTVIRAGKVVKENIHLTEDEIRQREVREMRRFIDEEKPKDDTQQKESPDNYSRKPEKDGPEGDAPDRLGRRPRHDIPDGKSDDFGRKPGKETPEREFPGVREQGPEDEGSKPARRAVEDNVCYDDHQRPMKIVTVIRAGKLVKEKIYLTEDEIRERGVQIRRFIDEEKPKDETPRKRSPDKYGTKPEKDIPERVSSNKKALKPEDDRPRKSPESYGKRPGDEQPGKHSPDGHGTKPGDDRPYEESRDSYGRRPRDEIPDRESPERRERRPGDGPPTGEYPYSEERPEEDYLMPGKKPTGDDICYDDNQRPMKIVTVIRAGKVVKEKIYLTEDEIHEREVREMRRFIDEEKPKDESPRKESPEKYGRRPEKERPERDSPDKKSRKPRDDIPGRESPARDERIPKDDRPRESPEDFGKRPAEEQPGKKSPDGHGRRPVDVKPERHPTETVGRPTGDKRDKDTSDNLRRKPGEGTPERKYRDEKRKRPEDVDSDSAKRPTEDDVTYDDNQRPMKTVTVIRGGKVVKEKVYLTEDEIREREVQIRRFIDEEKPKDESPRKESPEKYGRRPEKERPERESPDKKSRKPGDQPERESPERLGRRPGDDRPDMDSKESPTESPDGERKKPEDDYLMPGRRPSEDDILYDDNQRPMKIVTVIRAGKVVKEKVHLTEEEIRQREVREMRRFIDEEKPRDDTQQKESPEKWGRRPEKERPERDSLDEKSKKPGDDEPERRPDYGRPSGEYPEEKGKRPEEENLDSARKSIEDEIFYDDYQRPMKTVTVIRGGKVVKEKVYLTEDEIREREVQMRRFIDEEKPRDDTQQKESPVKYSGKPEKERPERDSPDKKSRKPGDQPERESPDRLGRRPRDDKADRDTPHGKGQKPEDEYLTPGSRPTEDDILYDDNQRPMKIVTVIRAGKVVKEKVYLTEDEIRQREVREMRRFIDEEKPKDESPRKESPEKYGRKPEKDRPERDSPNRKSRKHEDDIPGRESPVRDGRKPGEDRPDRQYPDTYGRRPEDDRPDRESPVRDGRRPGDDRPDRESPVRDGRRPGDDRPDRESPVRDGRRPGDNRPDRESPVRDGRRPGEDRPDRQYPDTYGRRPGDDRPDRESPVRDGRKPCEDSPDTQYPDAYGKRPVGVRPDRESPERHGRKPVDERPVKRPVDDSPNRGSPRMDKIPEKSYKIPNENELKPYDEKPEQRASIDHPSKDTKRPRAVKPSSDSSNALPGRASQPKQTVTKPGRLSTDEKPCNLKPQKITPGQKVNAVIRGSKLIKEFISEPVDDEFDESNAPDHYSPVLEVNKVSTDISASHAHFASSLRAPSLHPERPDSPNRIPYFNQEAPVRKPDLRVPGRTTGKTTPPKDGDLLKKQPKWTSSKPNETRPSAHIKRFEPKSPLQSKEKFSTSPNKSPKKPQEQPLVEKEPRHGLPRVESKINDLINRLSSDTTSSRERRRLTSHISRSNIKKRTGTPGVSPTVSPVRDGKTRKRTTSLNSSTPSSPSTEPESEVDARQPRSSITTIRVHKYDEVTDFVGAEKPDTPRPYKGTSAYPEDSLEFYPDGEHEDFPEESGMAYKKPKDEVPKARKPRDYTEKDEFSVDRVLATEPQSYDRPHYNKPSSRPYDARPQSERPESPRMGSSRSPVHHGRTEKHSPNRSPSRSLHSSPDRKFPSKVRPLEGDEFPFGSRKGSPVTKPSSRKTKTPEKLSSPKSSHVLPARSVPEHPERKPGFSQDRKPRTPGTSKPFNETSPGIKAPIKKLDTIKTKPDALRPAQKTPDARIKPKPSDSVHPRKGTEKPSDRTPLDLSPKLPGKTSKKTEQPKQWQSRPSHPRTITEIEKPLTKTTTQIRDIRQQRLTAETEDFIYEEIPGKKKKPTPRRNIMDFEWDEDTPLGEFLVDTSSISSQENLSPSDTPAKKSLKAVPDSQGKEPNYKKYSAPRTDPSSTPEAGIKPSPKQPGKIEPDTFKTAQPKDKGITLPVKPQDHKGLREGQPKGSVPNQRVEDKKPKKPEQLKKKPGLNEPESQKSSNPESEDEERQPDEDEEYLQHERPSFRPKDTESRYAQDADFITREKDTVYTTQFVLPVKPKDDLQTSFGTIELAKSSRESTRSPDHRLLSCVSVNENETEELHPRYADNVIEPDDDLQRISPQKLLTSSDTDEIKDDRRKSLRDMLVKTTLEKINREHLPDFGDTDMKIDTEDKPKISVAERVNKFMEDSMKPTNRLPSRPEDITLKGLDDTINEYLGNNQQPEDITETEEFGINSVRKAKTMFETIANKQPVITGTAKREYSRQDDIISRPSVFQTNSLSKTDETSHFIRQEKYGEVSEDRDTPRRPGDSPDRYGTSPRRTSGTPDDRGTPRRPGDSPDRYGTSPRRTSGTPDDRDTPRRPGDSPDRYGTSPRRTSGTPDDRDTPRRPGDSPDRYGTSPRRTSGTPDDRDTPRRPGDSPDRYGTSPRRTSGTPDDRDTPRRPGDSPDRYGTSPRRTSGTPDGRDTPRRPGDSPDRYGTSPKRTSGTPDDRRTPKGHSFTGKPIDSRNILPTKEPEQQPRGKEGYTRPKSQTPYHTTSHATPSTRKPGDKETIPQSEDEQLVAYSPKRNSRSPDSISSPRPLTYEGKKPDSATKKSPSKELADQFRKLNASKKDAPTTVPSKTISNKSPFSKPKETEYSSRPLNSWDRYSSVDYDSRTTAAITSHRSSSKSPEKISDKPRYSFDDRPKVNGYLPSQTPILPASKKQAKIPENSTLKSPALLKKQKGPEDKEYPGSFYRPANAGDKPQTWRDAYHGPSGEPSMKDGSPFISPTSKTPTKKTTRKGFADVGKKETELDRTFDLDILERMLEEARGYEERRLIRAQIRIVKKMIENNELPQPPSRRSSEYDTSDRGRSSLSPSKSPPKEHSPRGVDEYTTRVSEVTTETVTTRRLPGQYHPNEDVFRKYPVRSSVTLTLSGKPDSADKKPLADKYSRPKGKTWTPDKEPVGTLIDSETRRRTIEQRRSQSPKKLTPRQFSSGDDFYPGSKAFGTVSKTIRKSHTEQETKETNITDSVISSYGVGPTDDKGRPLFGLQALRRHKNKLDDQPDNFAPYDAESPRDIKDSSGRAFFGLNALRTPKSHLTPRSEPESSTFKDSVTRNTMVQKHSSALLRDSLLRDENDEDYILRKSDPERVNQLLREPKDSLKDLIKRHEDLMDGDQKMPSDVTSTSYSTSTVIKSTTVRRPDGTVSVKKNVIQGETTARNGEEPQTRITTSQYSYETPDREPVSITEVDSEEESLLRRKSTSLSRRSTSDSMQFRGSTSPVHKTTSKSSSPDRTSNDKYPTSPIRSTFCNDADLKSSTSRKSISDRLTQLSKKFSNDSLESPIRKAGVKDYSDSRTSSYTNTFRSSLTEKSSLMKNDTESHFSDRRRSTTAHNDDLGIYRRGSVPTDDEKEPLYQKHSGAEDTDQNISTYTRIGKGSAVRALSEKFQRAVAEAESPKTVTTYPKAGLILRSTSFKQTNGELTTPDSPGLKHSTSMEVRVGSPTRSQRTDYSVDRSRTDFERSWSPSRNDSTAGYGGDLCEKRVVTTTEKSTEIRSGGSRSFLGSNAKVKGVQDVISRMRAADLEDAGDNSASDSEARALLNKFLGASIMMSGMEPLVKGSGASSATLVSQVERQRILDSPTRLGSKDYFTSTKTDIDFDNIDTIWDEGKLRQLLDACTDYEGRRKIRARLRTVMADKSACEELVAAAREEEDSKRLGDSNKSIHHQGESFLPYLVQQLRTSLTLEPHCASSPSSEEGASAHHVEDSGTESGEDLRLLIGLRDSIREEKVPEQTADKEILVEIQEILKKLQTTLDSGLAAEKALDSETRKNLLQLVIRLQSSLKMDSGTLKSPEDCKNPYRNRLKNRRLRQNRHTIGVTKEELADARRLLEETSPKNRLGLNSGSKADDEHKVRLGEASYGVLKQSSAGDLVSNSASKSFRPVQFSPTKPGASPVLDNVVIKPFSPFEESQLSDKSLLNSSSLFKKIPKGNHFHNQNSCAAGKNPNVTPSKVIESSLYYPESTEEKSTGQSRITNPPLSKIPPGKFLSKNASDNNCTSGPARQSSERYIKSYLNPTCTQYPANGPKEQNNCQQNFAGRTQSVDPEGRSVPQNKGLLRSNTFMEANMLSKVHDFKRSLSEDHSASLLEYDPSVGLLTPELSVKIAVHKAAINKQLSQEMEKRNREQSVESDLGSSNDEPFDDDGDVSSETEEESLTVKQSKQFPATATGFKVKSSTQPTNGNILVRAVLKNGKSEGCIPKTGTENNAQVRPNPRSIKELQKAYGEKKEKEGERTGSIDARWQASQNVQAQYEKTLANQVSASNAKLYTQPRQHFNSKVRPKYEVEDKISAESSLSREKPIGNELDIGQGEMMNVSQTESEISVSSTSTDNSISHAQKLLQLAMNDNSSRYYDRSNKKSKMKRSNTIDIPKPLNFYEVEDCSDYSEDERRSRKSTPFNGYLSVRTKPNVPPQLKPKTDSDRKFVAFLSKESQPPVPNIIWNRDHARDSTSPAPFSEHQWGNRFSRIKTAFENPSDENGENVKLKLNSPAVSSAKAFWKSADDSAAVVKSKGEFYATANGARLTRQGSRFLKKLFDHKKMEERTVRLPWTNPQTEKIVVGSLSVYPQQRETEKIVFAPTERPAKPLTSKVNQFHHAPISAFKPVQKMASAPLSDRSQLSLDKENYWSKKPFGQNFQQAKLILSPTLPWIKDNAVLPEEKPQSATFSKGQTVSVSRNQDSCSSGAAVASPLQFISKSPSQESLVQRRSESLTPSHPNVSGRGYSVKEKAKSFQSAYQKSGNSQVAEPTKKKFSPVTTYCVDVASTSTVYDMRPEKSDFAQPVDADTSASTPEEHVAVTKVMGSPVQQQAVTIKQKTHRKDSDDDNRCSAVMNLASVLQRFSNPDQKDVESLKKLSPGKSSASESNSPRALHVPPNLPTGKTSPVLSSPGSTGSRFHGENPYAAKLQEDTFKSSKAAPPAEKSFPIPTARRTSSADSLMTTVRSEELKENGESVLTTRLQIPVYAPSVHLRTVQNSSPDRSPSRSLTPSFPNSSLQKSESWHQLNGQCKPKRPQSLFIPNTIIAHRRPSDSLLKTKSSHALGFGGKQFEATLTPSAVETKQKTVSEYFSVRKQAKSKQPQNKQAEPQLLELDDNMENVDEAFEALFSSFSSSGGKSGKSNSQIVKSNSTADMQQTRKNTESITSRSDAGGLSKTRVSKTTTYSTSTTSSTNKPISPFAKFQQLDRQNSQSSSSMPSSPRTGNAPLFTFTDPKLSRSASGVKDRLLYWCQVKTKNYKNVQIENFSTSWSNGLAFCALIHHFKPEAFDYEALSPKERRKNFELAFRVAEEEAGIAPLLDVDDMVMMKKPDWKCVFTYVQSIYRRFKDEEI